MTRCSQISDELKAYLDGELPIGRRTVVRFHFVRCARCREEMGEMETISKELRAAETDEFSVTLRKRLLDSVPEGLSATEPESIAAWKRRPLQLWGVAAAAAILFFLLLPMFPAGRLAKSPAASTPTYERAGIPSGSELAPNRAPDGAKYQSAGAPTGGADARPTNSSEVMPSQPGKIEGETSMAPGAAQQRFKQDRGVGKGTGSSAAAIAPTPPTDSSVERKIARNASLTLRVVNLEAKSEAVERLVSNAGGYVANNQLSTGGEGLKTAALTVRVPVQGFDQFLRDLAKLGEVTAKNVTGQDITERLGDSEEEARVIRSELAQMRSRLSSSSRTAGDKESERLLRVRVAQAEGRLELMRNLAALGKVKIHLSETPKTAIKSGGFLNEISDTGRAAVNSFMNAARIPLLLLIWIAAYAPVWVPLAIGFRYASLAHRRSIAAREARDWRTSREGANA